MKKDNPPAQTDDLRRRAETLLKTNGKPTHELSIDQALRVAEELSIYKVELEMQNEELRNAQVRLEESRQQLSQLYELAPVAYFTLDAKGVIRKLNRQAEQLLGMGRQRLLHKPLSAYVAQGKSMAFLTHLNDTQKNERKRRLETALRRPDGSSVSVEVESVAINEDGNVRVLSAMTDVTERKRLEERLHESQKMEAIGTLAGGIAHDFNNMLAVVLGNAELAQEECDPRGAGHYIEQIVKASKRARDLVRQVLTFSRKHERQRKPLKVEPLLKETVKLLQGSLPSTIDVWLEIKTESDTILADPSQVQQVIINLATNAAHAMGDDGGRLVIGLSEVEFKEGDQLPDNDMEYGRYLKLTVTDTGTGIPKEIRKRIFEPFFTTKEPGKGTGMGLSVVYGIVKSHQGAITVESKVGRGTTFVIFFPATQTSAKDEAHENRPIPTGKESILVVDDEPSVVEMASDALTRLGYQVTTAVSGPDGWKKFKQNPNAFDLVITDQIMPDMTGMKLAERVFEVRRDIPVILFTGYTENLPREKAKAAGINELLIKPVETRELAVTIRRVLKRKEADKARPS